MKLSQPAHNQVTPLTVCALEQGRAHSVVVVSDDLQHYKYVVNVFLQAVLLHLDSTVCHFQKIRHLF